MSAGTLLAAAGIAFLAALCQSMTAFGFALVMVPLLALAWEVKPAVVTSALLGTGLIIPLLYEVRARVRASYVVPMLAGSLLGVPAGLAVLRLTRPAVLQVLVASLVIVAALAIQLSPPLRLQRPSGALSFLVGGLSGTLRAATSMGGPPAVLYVLAVEQDVERFRATLLALYLPTGLLTLAGLAVAGLISRDVLLVSGAALPGVVLGSLTGVWLRGRVSGALFRVVVLGILIASSLTVLLSAAGALG